VRGEVAGVMVEKIYPLSFTKFKKVILLDAFKTRKSKLYYLRDKIGKDAKMKSKITSAQRDSDIMKTKKE
jgi:large subunit ribosomal protein L19